MCTEDGPLIQFPHIIVLAKRKAEEQGQPEQAWQCSPKYHLSVL